MSSPQDAARAKRYRDSEKGRATRASYRRPRRLLLDQAKDRPCADCGVRYPPCVMDFDHRDPSLKSFNIGKNAFTRSPEELCAEIAKCDVVCANCHRIRTWVE